MSWARSCLTRASLMTIALALVSSLALGGCAGRRTMQGQAVIIAASVEQLDDDLVRLEHAFGTVDRLRRVRIEGDRLAAERAARETEMLLGAWRLELDPLAQAKLEVFEGVREASTAAGTHAYGLVDYKLAVERPIPGQTLDRATLHRLVALLLRLAKPGSALNQATFFVEYAVSVGNAAADGVNHVVKMANQRAVPKSAPVAGAALAGEPEPEPKSESESKESPP